MARIGVVHRNLMNLGGAEAVCINTIESLLPDHDVTLVTLASPDFDALNRYFGTALSDVPVRTPRIATVVTKAARGLVSPTTGFRFDFLREALFARYARSIENEFDLMVSTDDEHCFDGPSVQYINLPRLGLLKTGGSSVIHEIDRERDSRLRQKYFDLCFDVAGFEIEKLASSVLLANSEWTADLVEQLYGEAPEVVYPPVDTEEFEGVPWEQRENGFVCIGRLVPQKKILRNIKIVRELVRTGHDVHLHVVGPKGDGGYYERIRRAADDHEFVTLEGKCPRQELVRMISTHRYGIHGKEHEHFGMVVAEFLAGGAIPFVPDSGGQRDIVENRDELTYESHEDAVEKIDRVLSDENLREELQVDPREVRDRFGREKFKTEMRDVVEERFS